MVIICRAKEIVVDSNDRRVGVVMQDYGRDKFMNVERLHDLMDNGGFFTNLYVSKDCRIIRSRSGELPKRHVSTIVALRDGTILRRK